MIDTKTYYKNSLFHCSFTSLMEDSQKYAARGVSASKSEVHDAIKNLDKGLYPLAFCKVLPDIVGASAEHCNIMHADTAGTKTSLAYIYWKETGDMSVWRGVTQDSIVMNVDDMACVGCVDNIVLSSTIGRNKNLIPGSVLKEIIQYTEAFCDMLRSYGIGIHLAGGETADVGDIVRTIDIGFTTFSRMRRDRLIVNDVKAGNVIVGFSSSGQASYESAYNGGMGSNGLTSARHDVFQSLYRSKYPESYDNNSPLELMYCGSKSLVDEIEIDGVGAVDVGKLVLSPTRTYLPLIKRIVADKIPIDGMIHCTGGAQTKVMKFVKNKKIIKDSLFELPPLFQLIEEESGTDRKEMYQVFNMGHRLEVYADHRQAKSLISLAAQFNIEAKIIGYVEDAQQNSLTIKDDQGEYHYAM